MTIRTILKKLLIVQEISNEERHSQGLERLGKGYFKAYRINPYNPLSYFTVLIMFIVGVLMYGFVGVWKEVVTYNPFKWY